MSGNIELVVPPATPQSQPPQNLALVLSICGKALKTFGSNSISTVNVLIVLQHIIMAVSKISSLSDEDKKQLVLDSIHWLINNQTNLSVEEKQTLDLLAITIFPQAVELLSAEKDTILRCFSCCTKK